MRARVGAVFAMSGMLAVGLAGCTLVTPLATQKHYDPSDGVSLNVGDLELRNVLVVSDDGTTGSLVATAVNTTDSELDFTFQWKAGSTWREVELSAEPNGRTQFGFGDGERVELDKLGARPGDLIEVVVHLAGDQGGVHVPVLDTSLAEYAD